MSMMLSDASAKVRELLRVDLSEVRHKNRLFSSHRFSAVALDRKNRAYTAGNSCKERGWMLKALPPMGSNWRPNKLWFHLAFAAVQYLICHEAMGLE